MNSSPKPDSPPTAISPGSRFGAYEILERLGGGGMGEVYRARDTRLGREVAIKAVSVRHHSDPDAISRFRQEACSASALNHPNIVTIYELDHVDGTQYIAMELVNGETLRQMLASGAIPFRKTVAIAAQIADALAKAHEIGIVHRDLKPDNLMVSTDGTVKVLDFGLAKLFSTNGKGSDLPEATLPQPLTEAGTIMGTVGYMSPEQATGTDLDFRSDQFSFGSVLYEMVTGKPAFRRGSSAQTLAAILRDNPEGIASRTLQAPSPFVWILERCLAKSPSQRYGSTRDLARDLAAVRDHIAEAPASTNQPRPASLPVERTTFVGREKEAAALGDLLLRPDVRLITLTGPGGIGKTRLAVHVARETASAFPAGVTFVALSSVTEATSVVRTIAQTLGLLDSGNQSAEQSLKEFLAGLDRPMLLLLDNFEHIVSSAPVIAELLSIGPNHKVIVTSQSPLHLYGEQEFPVPPLALPDSASLPPLDVLAKLPAVALFLERAKAVKRDFVLNKDNAASVAVICARLDGLPLAIELAAARIKLLSPSAMQSRLESCLNLLTGGARDLPTRQQTLRGTVDWSYGLLNTAEQTLFRRLSVFTGGCTLEAVEAVCDTSGKLGLDVLDGMASMVDKSLVRQTESADGDARFSMLSTIREYAREHLSRSGEESATRRAHAAYCLVLAEEGCAEITAHPEWLDRFELERDNFRSALDYLVQTGQVEWALRLGIALFRFWEAREYLTDGRKCLARILSMDGAASHPKLLARVLFDAAALAGEQADFGAAHDLFERSLDTCRSLGDSQGIAVAINALAVIARDRGDLSTARDLFEQSSATWKEIGQPSDVARALSNLANVAKLQGDLGLASSLYDECLRIFRAVADHPGAAWTLNYQGDVARVRGDFVKARSFYQQSLAAFRQLGDDWGTASVLSDLGGLSCDQANYPEAHRFYSESIRIFQSLGHKRGVARVLECLAGSAAAQSDAERCLRLAGAAASVRQRLGAPLSATEQLKLERALEPARKRLGNSAGMTAWMEGWALPIEVAVHEALR